MAELIENQNCNHNSAKATQKESAERPSHSRLLNIAGSQQPNQLVQKMLLHVGFVEFDQVVSVFIVSLFYWHSISPHVAFTTSPAQKYLSTYCVITKICLHPLLTLFFRVSGFVDLHLCSHDSPRRGIPRRHWPPGCRKAPPVSTPWPAEWRTGRHATSLHF